MLSGIQKTIKTITINILQNYQKFKMGIYMGILGILE